MSLLNYFIEANLALALISLVYFLFLRNETSFGLRRGYLVFGLTASVALPFVHIQAGYSAVIPSLNNALPAFFLPELVISNGKIVENGIDTNWIQTLVIGYLFITFVLMASLSYRIVRLAKILKQSYRLQLENYQLIECDKEMSSFSFFNYIVIGRKNRFTQNELDQIILHEKSHIRLRHSFDILLVELIQLFFWFNPVVYWIKRQLKEVHEFQADSAAVANQDTHSYCELIVRMALHTIEFPIANYFNQSQTLKRIIMINTPKTKTSFLKLSTIAISLMLLVVGIACQEQVKSENKVFTETDQPATPTAGIEAFYGDIASNLQYPEIARKMGIEGRVFVEFTVNTDGSLSDIHVQKGIHEECNKEAVRAITLSDGKWNPAKHEGKVVRQKLVLPITFKMQ